MKLKLCFLICNTSFDQGDTNTSKLNCLIVMRPNIAFVTSY